MKGIARIPIIGNLINTEKILTAMRDKLKASGSTWKAFGAGIKATFSEIGRIITDPLLMGIALLGIVKNWYREYLNLIRILPIPQTV